MSIEAGTPAPDFSLESTEDRKITLKEFRGKKVVLYFYPKDDTPGCTAEACSFRDLTPDFKKAGAVILGVSPDDLPRHEKFKTKYMIPFPLLADPTHEVAQRYGVWKEKKNYGKTYMGIERTTFIIDATGKIAHIFPRVKVEGHIPKVLDVIKSV